MRRISSLFLAVIAFPILLVSLVACGGPDPKKVAEKAVQAQLDGNLEELYELLCTEDRDAATLDNLVRFYKIPVELSDAMDLIPEVGEAIKVEKFESSVNGETATVTYFIHLPDLENMGNLSIADAQELMQVRGKGLKDFPEHLQKKIMESVKKNGVPTKSHAKQMQLRREGDDWKVYMDLAHQIKGGSIRTVYHVQD